MSKGKKIKELPNSDSDFWDGEKIKLDPEKIDICDCHTKDKWMSHVHYIDNKDGTISCKFCPWGCSLPGYMRVLDGRIIDLRNLNRDNLVKAS